MSDVDTIKSFLVSIGFKVDESSEGKFKGALENATKLALTLGAAVAAAATAVGVATAKMASDFDSLYFASQRTGASVETIKAFGYAVSQMGGTAEGATSSLESFARKMREMPALREQVNQFTGAGIGADGKILKENLEKIGDWFRSQPQYMRQNMAGVWGFDEKTMLAMTAGIDKFFDEYELKMKKSGLNPEKAAQDGRNFMMAWRSIWATFGNIVDGALSKIMGTSGDGLIAFGKWFDDHSGQISQAIADIGQSFADAFKGWGEGFGKVDWSDVGKQMGEFAKGAAELAGHLKDLMTWLGRLASFVVNIDQYAPGLVALKWLLTPSGANAATMGGGDGAGGVGDGAGGGVDNRNFWQRHAPTWAGGKAAPGGSGADAKGSEGKGDGSRSFKNHNPGNIKYGPWEKANGAIGADANGFAIFPDDATGEKAQRALWERGDYAKLNVEDAARRWSEKGYGADKLGIEGGRHFSDLSEEEKQKLLANQRKAEGWFGQGRGGASDAMAPAGTSPIGQGTEIITSKGGAKFRVASQFAENFRGFINDYEAAGGVIGPNHGGLGARPGNASYHPLGRAIDVNQIGRGVRAGGKSLPLEIEDQIAHKWGLRSGNEFRSNDNGHFEVNDAARAMEAIRAMRGPSQPNASAGGWNGLNWKPADRSLFDATPAPAPGHQSFNNNSSSSSAALHANTTINVHGGNADAGTIAQSVAANQSRINANLIRNMQGAVA